EAQDIHSRRFAVASAVASLFIAAHELYWIALPRFPNELAAYLSSFIRLRFLINDGHANLPLIIGMLGLAALVTVAVLKAHGATRTTSATCLGVSLVFAACATLCTGLALYSDLGLAPSAQLQARNQAVFVSAALALLAIVGLERRIPLRAWMNA